MFYRSFYKTYPSHGGAPCMEHVPTFIPNMAQMPVTFFVCLPQINLQFFVQLNLHYHSSNVASGRETIPLEVSRRTWKPNNHRVPLRLRPGRFDDCHIHNNFSPQRVGEQSDSNAKLRTVNKEPMDAAPRSVECWIARMILFLEVKSNVQENRLMVSKSLKLFIYIYMIIYVYICQLPIIIVVWMNKDAREIMNVV